MEAILKEKLQNPAEGFKPTDAQELYIDLKKILLATDGSKSAISATMHAVNLAKLFKATIRAVFVDSYGEPSDKPIRLEDANGDSNTVNSGYHGLVIAQSYARENGVSSEEIIFKGNIVRKILTAAHEYKPDLIILGNSEKLGLKRTLGSVVNAVMNGTDVPVLVVREN